VPEPAIAQATASHVEMSFDGSQSGPMFAPSGPSADTAPVTTRRKKLVALVALGVAGALGSIVMAGWALSKRADGHHATSSSSASSSSSSSALALAVTPSAPANDTPPVVPAPSPSQQAATPPADATGPALLTVSCTPECDVVTVDGKAVTSFPAGLAPGSHTVRARRGAHAPQSKRVTLVAGKEETLSFVFFAKRAAPPPPKKPCGKFLQRCD
jgi:hypothetical protein